MEPRSPSDSDDELTAETHKKSLKKLKEIDPDFYSFLEENDKNLLNFDDDDEPSDNESDKEENNEIHRPASLQGNSDESDFEPDDVELDLGKKITLKMVSQWQSELQSDHKIKLTTLTIVLKAFNAAMLQVTTSDEDVHEAPFKVEGSSVFNSVIQLCVLHLPTALKKYLGIEHSGKDPQKCKHFVKIKNPLIAYFNDLIKLLGGVTSTNILTVLLKHLHQMSVYVATFGRISRQLLRKLITLWSTGEETVRVLAFLCILRITRNQQANLLEIVLKTMYLTFVKNCKFVSPTTWPGINFMRRSLVEMFSLDLNMSYQHVFLYIRQLAIHLRNAIVVQKVENRQAVYNWQYVNSMHLWAELLGSTSNKQQLQPLIYPLVMIAINTIRLVPTHQYYPLRFHCIEILIKLSKETGTFIPILPFLIEVLTNYDFNKRNKKVSMKPIDFSCILKLSKSQLMENGFKDAVIEKLYALILEYMANESYSIAFPDMSILAVMQIKTFIKKCSVANYTRKMRQLLEKIEENTRFIEEARSKISFSLSNDSMITAWETNIRNKGTPLITFYENWNKVNKIQKRKNITKNDETAESLPMIKRHKKAVKDEIDKGPPELFPSDSEDDKDNFAFGEDSSDKSEIKIKKQKKKKVAKQTKANISEEKFDKSFKEVPDEVQDFNVKDW